LNFLFGNNLPFIVGIQYFSFGKFRCMSDFEGYFRFFRFVLPWIFSNKMKIAHRKYITILRLHIVTAGNVNDIGSNVFFYHIPGPARKSQTFALSNGMKPVTFVFSQNFPCFPFYNWAFFFSQISTNEIIVVNFSQETDSLTVLSFGAGQTGFVCNAPYFAFH